MKNITQHSRFVNGFLFLLVCSLMVGLGNTAWATAPKDNANCQGAWLFLEGSGTTVADSSQNSNTGNFAGDGKPAWASIDGTNAPAYATNEVDFNGDDDYISCGSDASLDDMSAISVVFWVDTDSRNVYDRLVAKDGSGAGQWHIRWEQSNQDYLEFIKDGATDLRVATNSHGITDNTPGGWYHVAMTWDGSITAANVHFYVTGSELAYTTQTNGASLVSDAALNFFIGNRVGADRALDGQMTEVAVFDDVLTSTEVNDIMDNGLAGAVAGRTRRFFVVM